MKFIKMSNNKYLYYLLGAVVCLLVFLIIFYFTNMDNLNESSKTQDSKNDDKKRSYTQDSINRNTTIDIISEKELPKTKDTLSEYSEIKTDEISDNEKTALISSSKQKKISKSTNIRNKNLPPNKDDDNTIIATIEKLEKPVLDDTIILLPENEKYSDENEQKKTIYRQLSDGINVALFENQSDNLDTAKVIYKYTNTFNEAILRRIKKNSKIEVDFKNDSRVTFSDYLFKAENKLIKVRLIAFEEEDDLTDLYMPEAFSVNIINWNDEMLEMDWFINSGILEIPPENIEIQISGKNYIKIAIGGDAIYGIGYSN